MNTELTNSNPAPDVPLIFPIKDRPAWRRDPRAITFLKANRPGRYAAKQWIAGRKEPIDYALVSLWHPFVALADGIEGLSAVLMRAAGFPRLTAVRGAVREASIHNCTVNRRIHEYSGKPLPDMEDAPRHWLMVDLDSLPEPDAFDWRSDTRCAAIWAARQYLPPAFRKSAFHYQYSGSAGMKPGLRLHFWFWLSEPLSSAEAKRYMNRVGKGKVDLSLYNPVQPHYTAAPIFIRLDDPLAGERGGLVL